MEALHQLSHRANLFARMQRNTIGRILADEADEFKRLVTLALADAFVVVLLRVTIETSTPSSTISLICLA